MRVLFLASDGISATVRIRPLLEHLRDCGKIEDFACVDRDLAIIGSGGPFDVVMVHRNPGSRQIAWLRGSGLAFVYDVDDLLLPDAIQLDWRRTRERDAIRWCLANARAVTSPSRRLLATLDSRLAEPLGSRAIHLPNAGFEPIPAVARPAARPHLLWASSHGVYFEELAGICAGIAAAARAIGTQVTLVGRFPDAVHAAIPGHVHVPWLEIGEYQRFLAGGSFVAATPLPAAMPPAEQAFLDCKSDIKAAQFCSLGIAALYSPVPPYTDSDLPCTIAPTNTAADWQDGLIALAKDYPAGGERLAQHPALAARRRDVAARQLFDILSLARSKASIEFRVRPRPALLRRLEQRIRSIRSRIFR